MFNNKTHIIYSTKYAILHLLLYIIKYGHEAKPSILGLLIVFLAARRDYYGGDGDYRARQEL